MLQLIAFLQELLNRFRTDNPPFFKKLQVVFSIVAIFIGLGIVLKWNIPYLNPLFDWMWFTFFAGSVGMSQLPTVTKSSDEGAEGGVGNRPDDRKPGNP